MREFEENPLKCREARRIQMFDHLNHRRGVEAAQSLIAIHQRTLDKIDAGFLLLWQLIEFQTFFGDFQRTPRNIHAENRLELRICQQIAQELALAAAQIKHSLYSKSAQYRHD